MNRFFLGSSTIDFLLKRDVHSNLSARQSRELKTIRMLYDQQREMYQAKTHRIDDRIVSISQPHVRPIVRGKAKAETKFGAKVAISMVDVYAFIEHLSWDLLNESLGHIFSPDIFKTLHLFFSEMAKF
jgi:IS5 family transposase